MKDIVNFLKTTGIYLIGNVLTKAISFFMLPIYTRYLNPSDYGTYDVNIAYITFLSSVLFLDIWSGIMRFMFDYSDDSKKYVPIFSGIIIFCCSSIAYIIFTFILGTSMHIEYLFWVLLYGLMINFQSLFAYIVRGFGKNSLFAISGIVGTIVTVLFNVIFIVFKHGGYEYLYVSSIIGMVIACVILGFGINFKKLSTSKNYNPQNIKELFVFSLPLMVNSVSWWFLTAFNRVAISKELSLADNGLYAVANKFSAIVQIVDQAFQMAWQEISFMKSGNKKIMMIFFPCQLMNILNSWYWVLVC